MRLPQTRSDRPLWYRGWPLPPDLVVLHYSSTGTAASTYEILVQRGLSVHATIERSGQVFRHVDDVNRCKHVGAGSWAGRSSLNSRALGIEIVNFGPSDGRWEGGPSPHPVFDWARDRPNDPELVPDPERRTWRRDETYGGRTTRVLTQQTAVLAGPRGADLPDHRATGWWATYPTPQVGAVVSQVGRWGVMFGALPEYVVGHEHVSPGRKTDPGPNDYEAYDLHYAYDAVGNFQVNQEYNSSRKAHLNYKTGRIDLFNGTNAEALDERPDQGNYRYDNNGNTTHTPRQNELGYSFDNQPVYVDLGGGGQVRYLRHADQRVVRMVNKTGVKALGVYLGPWEYHQRQGTTTYSKVVVHIETTGRHAQVERVLAGSDPDSVDVFYVHTDHLGSGHVLTSTSGTLLSQEEYLPYGRAVSVKVVAVSVRSIESAIRAAWDGSGEATRMRSGRGVWFASGSELHPAVLLPLSVVIGPFWARPTPTARDRRPRASRRLSGTVRSRLCCDIMRLLGAVSRNRWGLAQRQPVATSLGTG